MTRTTAQAFIHRLLLPSAALLVSVTSALAQGRANIEGKTGTPYASAIVVNADSGEPLFIRDAVKPVYPASVLKLMDLYVILDRIQQGSLRLDEVVTASVEAYRMGGSQVFLDVGEQFTVDELLYALMIQSANDAAVALAEHVAGSKEGFVRLMNEKAHALGMKDTTFASVHGLPPADGQAVDVTTARDIAILCRALLKFPDTLRYTSTTSRGFRGDSFTMQTHNSLLKTVPGCDGFKTGYFKLAGYSIAATAQRDGRRVIAVVMGSENKQARDRATQELIEESFRSLALTR